MRSRYTDRVRYVVSVLWCHGASESTIARLLDNRGVIKLSKGAVSGIINRAGDGALRSLDEAGRQEWLDRLKTNRLDGGLLTDKHFRVLAHGGRRS